MPNEAVKITVFSYL